MFFGHGYEIIIILVIALIVLGPGKIPEVAQTLGRGLRELRKASAELQRNFDVNDLMREPDPPPPPVTTPFVAEAMTADSPTILAPGDSGSLTAAAVKPKRVRRKPPATLDVAAEPSAESAIIPSGPAQRKRRASKVNTESVSPDAPA